MAEFVNIPRDEIGMQATLDKLVAGEIANFADDSVTALRQRAFYRNNTIISVVLPNAEEISAACFQECTNFRTLDLLKQIQVGAWFRQIGNSSFDTLFLRSEQLCDLQYDFPYSFYQTKFGAGRGGIYVPSSLLTTYRTAENWKYASNQIRAIEEYPVTDFSTIEDDWDTIISKLAAGTANYIVGDVKAMSYNDSTVYMQLVALNADDLADGSGKAKSTWLSKDVIPVGGTAFGVGATGWADSNLRSYVRDTVYVNIPSNIKSAIKEVTKTYTEYNGSLSTQSIADTVWVPSLRELRGNGSGGESTGVIYSDMFPSRGLPKYYQQSTPQSWWTRSIRNASNAWYVRETGDYNDTRFGYSNGFICLGFCI